MHEDQSFEAISYINNAKVNETTIVEPNDHEDDQNFDQGDEEEKVSSPEIEIKAMKVKDQGA